MSVSHGTPGDLDLITVEDFLLSFQDRVCTALEGFTSEAAPAGGARFREDRFDKPGGGVSRTRVLSEGEVFESAAVNFSHSRGAALPPAATERRPELAGRRFEAVSVSLIVHPRNPYVPTTHANVRFFAAYGEDAEPVWWCGGGFDLTPYYGFEDDARHWHLMARAACVPFGESLYQRFKAACDRYFFLPHRGEPRGVGGLFYDDFDEGGFANCFGLTRSVADHFLLAYLPIVERRLATPYGERERDFQLYRRGRYAEFNLLYDRGTRFGIQSAGRAESILASLPPRVIWRYDWAPEAGTQEARLYRDFLRPRDWLGEDEALESSRN